MSSASKVGLYIGSPMSSSQAERQEGGGKTTNTLHHFPWHESTTRAAATTAPTAAVADYEYDYNERTGDVKAWMR